MDIMKKYHQWLEDACFDADTKSELQAIAGDEKEITERFYKELEFGTAGLRGIIGAGTNRMNCYTVRKATQGLANYILSQNTQAQGVAIAYDSRHMSPEFANEAALCLAANGIKAYIFPELRPTPELSFAVRYLGCTAGINITASHNPSNYNGYKVYWADGAQITPPHDKGIMAEVEKLYDFAALKTMNKEEAVEQGLYQVIGKDVDDAYIEELKSLMLNKDAIEKMKDELVVVYSPLHGTGNKPVRRLLEELGYTRVYVVKEQEEPDGDFPTVSYPNPEAEDAFALGLKMAKELHADLVLATDPDADRLGVYVLNRQTGEYMPLNGNMSGCLIGEYILSQRKMRGELPEDGAFIRSIVTSNMTDAIAEAYGVELIKVLTGFKYIGQKMLEFDQKGTGTYLFGMEESYGCLPGTYARDKDAVAATMVLCEAAAYYKMQGKTLWDAMVEMFETYGYYRDHVISVTMEGKEGLEKIQSIMEALRKDAPKVIGGFKVEEVQDYMGETGLPKANVLIYLLEGDAWAAVRPSGTEPKIKVYLGVKGKSFEDGDEKMKLLIAGAEELLQK